ncbi:hypothetical protein HYN48_02745 [Flavobacterium magnum]|uniref:DUF5689 domain-containing protein n=1 Tax=Flavobacterium magnum TaxID=2162713 RepID=A0A2S0RC27_9FLAO|nr:DUF5689 domain-containing protein [Flavobacterium magnum]AWA29089.1 hypothetical protein HYN48_02745 [Flavobacterium magnum]
MKTTILKSVLFVTLAAGFNSCVNDDDYAIPSMDCTETNLVKTKEVSEIPFGTLAQYTANEVIEAYVTSSDEGGNFFKTISFQTLDGSRAFSVPVDASSTFVNLEPGRKVFIKLQNLYTDSPNTAAIGPRIGGVYINASGTASVGRLPESQFKEVVVRSCTVVDEEQLVQRVTIPQLLEGNTYLNKLVELDNVQFADDAINKTYYVEGAANTIGGATNISLTDIQGNSIDFRTSSFANFAGKMVATGNGKVRGVLTKYGTGYQFLARTERDIMLTNPRVKSLLNETFTNSLGNWTTFNVLGAETWAHSPTFGNPGGMAKMSGYNNGNKANEDWLISPAQDLTALTSATLSFDNAFKFDGNPIVVLISKDYNGVGNPTDTSNGTWTTLSGATLSTGNYAYANSGNLNISAFTGSGAEKVYVAFKYTSTTAAASTWEIDNVKILPAN